MLINCIFHYSFMIQSIISYLIPSIFDHIYSLKRIDSKHLLSLHFFLVIWHSQLVESQFLSPICIIHTVLYIYYSYQQSWAFLKKKKSKMGRLVALMYKPKRTSSIFTNITWTGLGFDIYKNFLSRLTHKLMPTHKVE